MNNRKELIALVGIIGVALIFFYKTIMYGLLPIPSDALVGLYHPYRDLYAQEYPRGVPFKNFLITDPVRQQIPWRHLAIDYLKQSRVPSWNPYSFSGTPLLGNIQAGSLYPLNVVFFVLPFVWGWTALIIIQPVFAGIFMYMYLRGRGISAVSSVFGSVVYMFCGFSVAWLTWGTIVHTALWTPLILWSIDRITGAEVKGKKRKTPVGSMLVLALATGMILLAGHAQVALYMLTLCGVYAVWQWRLMDAKHISHTKILWMVLGIGGGVLVASPQLNAFAELLSASSRFAGSEKALSPGWFIPIGQLIQFIVPDFFGNPATMNYWGEWNYGEFIGYTSVAGMFFAIMGVAAKAKRDVWFWVGAIAVSLLFSVSNPISRALYTWDIPVISSMQPTRLVSVIDIALAILAAYGLERWMTAKKRTAMIPIVLMGVIVAVLWGFVLAAPGVIAEDATNLAVAKRNLIIPTFMFLTAAGLTVVTRIRSVPISVVSMAVVLMATIDLYRFGWKFTPFTQAAYLYPETKITTLLSHVDEPFRVASADARVLPGNTTTYYRLEDIGGYDPLYYGRYERFIAAVNADSADVTPPYGFDRMITLQNMQSDLLPMTNLRFVFSIDEISDPQFTHIARDGVTNVYEYTDWQQRATLVTSPQFFENGEDTLAFMFSDIFEPTVMAAVEGHPVHPDTRVSPDDRIWAIHQDMDILAFESETSDWRFVFVSNIYDTSWHAHIDGKDTPLYRVNYVYQGLWVPPGRHTVQIRYEL